MVRAPRLLSDFRESGHLEMLLELSVRLSGTLRIADLCSEPRVMGHKRRDRDEWHGDWSPDPTWLFKIQKNNSPSGATSFSANYPSPHKAQPDLN